MVVVDSFVAPLPRCAKKSNFFQFVGPSIGHHSSYTFYKAVKYVKNGQTSILGLGEFFFVKIWPKSDLLAVGELQLIWEDKNTNQILSSLRLYFLPEYTPEGRMTFHGEVRIYYNKALLPPDYNYVIVSPFFCRYKTLYM